MQQLYSAKAALGYVTIAAQKTIDHLIEKLIVPESASEELVAKIGMVSNEPESQIHGMVLWNTEKKYWYATAVRE